MKSVFKILLIATLVIALVFAAALGYLISNKKILTDFVLAQINKELSAELKIESSDVTLFKNFPNVSLDLLGVSISKNNSSIFKANHVYLGFNIEDIINKNYHIQVIKIDSGQFQLVVDKKGQANFDIIKPKTTAEKDTSSFLVELEKVKFDNVAIRFTNYQTKQLYHTFLNNAEFEGKFSNKVFDLKIDAKALVEKCSAEDIEFITDKKVELSASININNELKTYIFKNAALKIDELDLLVNGSLKETAKGNNADIRFDAKKISITSLLSILPITLPAEVLAYQTSGNVYFKGSVIGLITPHSNPRIETTFGINNGSLKNEKLNLSLHNISLLGEFNNGDKKTLATSSLYLKNVKAQLLNDNINANIQLTNLAKPLLDLSVNGSMDLNNLFKLFPNKSIEKISGTVNFDSKIKANLKDADASKIWKQAGNYGNFDLNINELKVKDIDKTINNLKATFGLNGADLKIENCALNLNQTDVSIKGYLNNFLGYLFSANEILDADINYKSDFVDLAHVIFAPTNAENAKNKSNQQYNLPKNIRLTLNASIKELRHKQFIAHQVETKLQVLPMQIMVEKFTCSAFNGTLALSTKIVNSTQGNYFVESKINIKNIQLTDAFKQCENFGQNNITYQNISGTYSGNIDFAGVWDEKLNCKKDKILALISVQIKNGQLINYKPLEALSKYISLSDLQNLKFADLNNTIEIKQQTIVIPKMQIDNNALNITMSGSQNFDNFLDYNLKLNLTELLKKKRKPKDNEFGEEDEKTKGLNLFISMRGPIDNLKISYDKANVKANIKQNIKQEGQTIKELIKKEFGTNTDNKNNEKPKEKDNDNDELEFEKE